MSPPDPPRRANGPGTPLMSLGDVLSGNVAALESQARRMLALADRVRALLPGPERAHVLAAGCRHDQLTITMDSASWVPQVHFAADRLLQALNDAAAGQSTELWVPLTHVKVRVGRPD